MRSHSGPPGRTTTLLIVAALLTIVGISPVEAHRLGPAPFSLPVEEGRILTVTVSVGGRVVSDPPLFDCRGPATCAGAEPPGSEISFTAIADPGFRFVGWAELSAQISSGSCTGPDLCAFEIDDDIDIAGVFERTFTRIPQPAAGDKIAFISSRMTTPHSAPDVWVMDVDGSNSSRLAPGGPAFLTGTSRPEWSPDGTRIAFTMNGNEREVWVMNADGTNPVNLTGTAGGTDPAWSPDGTRIAFTSHRTGTDQIWVMNADGTNPAILTTSPGSSARSPAWSPDGTRIAFSSNRAGVSIEFQIWVMNADGTNPTNLTGAAGGLGGVAWSPEGSRIAFESSRTGKGEVWVMNADGANPTNLTGGAGGWSPTWSPDGTRIAFTDDRTGDPEIWVMNANGSNPVQLTDSPGFDGHPAWQPVAESKHTRPERPRHRHRDQPPNHRPGRGHSPHDDPGRPGDPWMSRHQIGYRPPSALRDALRHHQYGADLGVATRIAAIF